MRLQVNGSRLTLDDLELETGNMSKTVQTDHEEGEARNSWKTLAIVRNDPQKSGMRAHALDKFKTRTLSQMIATLC